MGVINVDFTMDMGQECYPGLVEHSGRMRLLPDRVSSFLFGRWGLGSFRGWRYAGILLGLVLSSQNRGPCQEPRKRQVIGWFSKVMLDSV